ncbi:Protease inhibitor I8, cysteine-rich trypsin inhibitor-like protein [Cordyceps fumosorosea ARSEF 2679]|uniref:Protease inhibitor I8, cysteine-rich trypsin inhibitor-like protein n=1 Tax=Cordyceps fumosorosea (strain ARSEF 2679) TaxID=1081104 RepID=A0A168AKB1_CORFA|nr:Protease inhibitor I8, cysteine-rich trypsin inhibitor-like protein [Cordyceps fumosorosea ARSEF 2679]OAA68868.1 Protease inhibitor I8, cysteine-rich trypsin inhibitor-like protein [Cordyceps fumosorosea ARSEF 2679]
MKTSVPLAVALFALGVWSQACGVNEVRQDCGPVCQGCGNFQCLAIRCGGGCWCRPGFLRDSAGTCIPRDQCPKDKVSEPSSH